MPKLPPVIYVKWEPDNPPFLSADVTLKAMTESEPVRIGVYRLHDELDLRSVEEVRKKGSRRWFR